MLYVESDGRIRLTRGDTARLTITIENDLSGEDLVLSDTDTLILTVKKSTKDETPLFQKTLTNGLNTFHIKPEDTAGLSYGSYKYNVQLETSSGDVYTVITPTAFEVLQEVTW